VKERLVDPRTLGDFLHARTVDATADEDGVGGIEDAGSGVIVVLTRRFNTPVKSMTGGAMISRPKYLPGHAGSRLRRYAAQPRSASSRLSSRVSVTGSKQERAGASRKLFSGRRGFA
jgi:hypothetical protein